MDSQRAKIRDDGRTMKKKIRKLPNIVEPGFVAPDGGWGWMVILAAGFTNFCALTLVLAYGLLFRGYFERLGITTAQATTISNINNAVIAIVGLTNGPLFRRFHCRYVACFGSFLGAFSVCILSFMNTFCGILICYGFFHAIGSSLALSSSALALNTYFKKKRRMAIGLAWTCAGLAPIVIPQLVALWLPIYDVNGTVLLFGGIMFHAFACALLMQPVSRHVKRESSSEEKKKCAEMEIFEKNGKETNCALSNGGSKTLSIGNLSENDKSTDLVRKRLSQGFGSEYFFYDVKEQEDKEVDVMMVEKSMNSRTDDELFTKKSASNISLTSIDTINEEDLRHTKNKSTSSVSNAESSLMARSRLTEEKNIAERRNSNEVSEEKITTLENQYKNTSENCQKENIDDDELLKKVDDTTESLLGGNLLNNPEKYDQHNKIKKSWYKRAWRAFAVFFDLDLLQDPVYVNLMIGITLLNFSDMNLFQLTPFILGDYGFPEADVANIMSVLAIVDVIARLVAPITASYIGWENRIFYMLSIFVLSTSRILFAHLRSYNLLMAIAVFTAIGKAFRQVFVALVIPDHVPLERLPAAIGLQVASAGVTYLIFGPVVGWIRDVSGDYMLALHFLNLFPYLVMISWILELSYLSTKRKRLNRIKDRANSP